MSAASVTLAPTQGWTLRAVRHELRTPLNAVLGLSEALLSDVDGPLTDGQRENLTVIAGTARRLSDLFDDVLELSTDAPTDRFRTREAVDLGAVLEELAEALEQSRGVRAVHVRVTVEPDLSPALANPHRLQRLIGSVGRYVLASCNGELMELRACPHDASRARIEVFDPGRALGEGELSVLLSDEPSPLRRRGLDESARLRLSMFRQLAEREGGSFMLESSAAGTRMSVVLPTAAVSPSDPPPAFSKTHPPPSSRAEPAALRQEDKEHLRARFVASMGHDLRGPLNTILGFAELLVMEQHDAVAPEQRPAVDHIRQSAQDLLSLLDNTLDWARIEARQLVLDPTELLLDEALEEACAQAAVRAGARQLSIVFGGERHAALRVRADRTRLVQALLGLLDHAVRTDGNPPVTVRAEVMTDTGSGGSSRARVTLLDPGLRVRDEDHAGFFEAFRPSFEPSGRRVPGLGVGPAVARALIRAHGGDVWFTSDPERGTTFTFELPTL